MFPRPWLAAVAALLVVSAPALSLQNAPAGRRVVAIGDIHGAADAFVEILQAAALIDSSQRWIGGTTTLVQTGDYFDRGAGVRQILDLLMRLENEARRAGGRLDVLMGNHEVMNLIHDFRDVSPRAYDAFVDNRSEDRRRRAYDEQMAAAKRAPQSAALQADRDEWMKTHPPGLLEYVEALSPRGKYGRWLRARRVVAKVDDTIFMHAGLSPDLPGTIEDVNRSVERAIRTWDETSDVMVRQGLIRPYFTLQQTLDAAVGELQRISAALTAKQELEPYVTRDYVARLQELTTIGTSPLLAAEGPLWFRGLAQWSSPETDPQITALLTRHQAARFVVAHTPQTTGRIASRFDGRVFVIDTGMLSSVYKGGRPSALEIQGSRVTAIYSTEREALSKH